MFTLQLAAVCVAVLAAAAIAAYKLRTRPARHGRHLRRSVRFGLPTEIRRHRAGGDRAWAGTTSLRKVPPSTQHALDALDTTAERRRYVVANLIEPTGEITRADLETILGPRPAELIGASA